jgi:hypothetical protein
MHKLLITATIGLLLAAGGGVGCDNNKSTDASSSAPKKMMADDCAMCPGQQTANSNGTCPKCGMKVKG